MSISPIATRFNNANPCPVCDAGSKNCSVTADGLHLCRGEPAAPAAWRELGREDDAGFRHYRPVDDPPPPPRPKPPPAPPKNWLAESEQFARRLTPELRRELAGSLGLPVAALDALPLVGWTGTAFTFPECDGTGQVIGIATRTPDGTKRMVAGSKRGLTLAAGWRDRPGPGFLVEGPSDLLAMTAAGLCCVGRPSNSGGADHLAVLLGGLPADRPIVVVGENDQKAGGDWPGWDGAERLAQSLAGKLGRDVLIALPPADAKDVRGWLTHPDRADSPWPDRGTDLAEVLITSSRKPSGSPDRSPGRSPLPPPAGSRFEPEMVKASDVTPEAVEWLWHGRLPVGKGSLLASRPGDGKTFLTVAMAAVVTRGGHWPDGHPAPAGSVLMLNAEDDPADTLVPRLMAAGADRDRVHFLKGAWATDSVDPKKRQRVGIDLSAGLPLVEAAVDLLPDLKLLVVDPIGSYLGRGVDSHRDNEVRAVLAGILRLAADRRFAVLFVAHVNKSALNRFADDSVLGSRAFTGLVRAVHHLHRDPDDRRRRLFLPGKSNIAVADAGLAFTLEPVPLPTGDVPRIVWEPDPVAAVADDFIGTGAARGRDGPGRGGSDGRPPSERAEAAELLRLMLADGPRPLADIRKAANAAGLSWSTVKRAKHAAGITSQPKGGTFVAGQPPAFWWGLGEEWAFSKTSPPAQAAPGPNSKSSDPPRWEEDE